MRKPLLMFVAFTLLLSGCTTVIVTPVANDPTEVVDAPITPTEPTPTEETVPPIPTLIPDLDVLSNHSPVTLEDVKNINHSSEISVTKEGILLGLPGGVPEEEMFLVKEFCKAVQTKFFGSKVFYNKDESTGNWLLFARIEENLFHRVVSVNNGTSRFADYPLKFAPSASGVGYKVVDFNKVITLQSESIDVIWKEGMPQFVYDEVEILPDRDRYFTKYLNYDKDANATDANLWTEVPGVYELIAAAPTPVPTDVEKDLNPSYIQSTDFEYLGVRIKAELITDSSLNSRFTKVTVPDATYADFIARVVFRAWWNKGSESHSGMYTDADFESFMSLWSIAQKSGNVEDWEKVQLDGIFANDLNDGNGYVPKAYNIWPMYEGDKPLRAKGISVISFVVVDTSSMRNIDQQSDINGTSYDIGWGTNLEGERLLIYSGTDTYLNTESNYNLGLVADGMLTTAAQWLIHNSGNGRSTSFEWTDLHLSLFNGGLSVQ